MATVSAKTFLKGGSATLVQPINDSSGMRVGKNDLSLLKEYVSDPIKEALVGGVGQTVSGYQESRQSADEGDLLGTVEGAAKMTAGVVNTAFSPLAPVFKPVEKGINLAADKISDSPAVQEFAQSPAGEMTSRVAEDVSNVNTIVGGVAAMRGTPRVAETAVQSGTKALESAAEGVKKAGPALQKAGKVLVEGKDAKALSIFTGENDAVIQSALKDPTTADIGIKGGDVALRQAVEKGSESSIAARSSFERGYGAAFKKLAALYPDKLVSRQRVLYQFVDTLEGMGVKVGKDGQLDFDTSAIKANPGEMTKIQSAYDAIVKWDDFSLEGTNQLKQFVGKLTRFPTEAGGTSKSPFLGRYYGFLNEEIASNLPPNARKVYQEMNQTYSQNIELYNEMVDAFNSGDPFTRISQLFGANKDSLRQIVDFYEQSTGNKISPIVAGRALAERKQAAFGFLNPRSWIDFFIDPEIQAQIVTAYGKLKQKSK